MLTTDTEVAAAAVDNGHLVVYPTETVYGLGADATDPAAVRSVFETKRRPPDDPVSLAVHDLDTAEAYVALSERERAFAREFLPGPVTLVAERRDPVPDVLTAGRDRVGLRVPDDDTALALLAEAGPLTATSANVSGNPSARALVDLEERLRTLTAVILDGGRTPGGASTVVDVGRGEVIREGLAADRVAEWLATH